MEHPSHSRAGTGFPYSPRTQLTLFLATSFPTGRPSSMIIGAGATFARRCDALIHTYIHTYIHTNIHTYLPLSISVIHLLFHGHIMAIDETCTPTLCSPRRVLPSTHVVECTLAHLAHIIESISPLPFIPSLPPSPSLPACLPASLFCFRTLSLRPPPATFNSFD
jgi:hypothetical protein